MFRCNTLLLLLLLQTSLLILAHIAFLFFLGLALIFLLSLQLNLFPTGGMVTLGSGGGFADWEPVFERLAFCAAFDGYRATIDQRAELGPPLFD